MPRIIITKDEENPSLVEFNSEALPRVGENMVFIIENTPTYYTVEHVGWVFHKYGLHSIEVRVTEVQQ